MIRTILIPIDFSACSTIALEFAAALARRTGAVIKLIHVLEIPVYNENDGFGSTDPSDVPFMMALLKSVRKRMLALKKTPFLRKIKVHHHIEVGPVATHIVHAADKYRADIIIMGSHGTSGYNSYFVGSNADKVARNIRIPLITIKHRVPFTTVFRIVFATDFSEEAIAVFPFVQRLAEYLDAELYLVKVITPSKFKTQRQIRDVINAFLETGNGEEYPLTFYNDTKKEAGIIHFADDIKANLIAIGTHGKSGLSRFFSGSVSEDLVDHAFLPVLTVNFSKLQ